MSSTVRRWLLWLLSALVATSLVVGVAFAGVSSNGGGADNGNKWGAKENKKSGGCPSGWYGTNSNGLWYDSYDLNFDGTVCFQYTGSGTDYVDNATSY